MYTGRLIFSQLMDVVPKYQFRKIVARHKGNWRVRQLTCWDQLLCLCFGQFTFRQSLRNLVSTLDAIGTSRYHMGIKNSVSRSTLSDANARRSWQIYHELAMLLVERAGQAASPAGESSLASIVQSAYALDSTTIDLCLSLFPWAEFRQAKGAIKLHTLMELETAIPRYIHISDGRTHDVNVLDIVPITAGDLYIMDRGYLDFERLFTLHKAQGLFIVRARKNLQFYRTSSRPVDKAEGVQCDQTIRLTTSKQKYPDPLRRVHLIDKEYNQDIVLLSNMAEGSAQQLADYYKKRWQIELFFKWIKQHLHIKAFYGQTVNAVKTQIWTAICSYLILIIVKESNGFSMNLHTMIQVVSVAVLQAMTLKELFSQKSLTPSNPQSRKQLGLFDF